jgi:hypothetical protein
MTENKLSLVDLGKLSKPISKLIEAVSQGIGTIYEPTKIRRKAKAQADASLIKVEGDIKKQELLKRAFNRFGFQEIRRQENIENIVEIAASSLPETVSEDPVDPGWISRFFDECKDVSNEELQQIWGRLLAGEVANPKSCSRKTLATLKDLSNEDAKLFIDFCSFVWIQFDSYFFPENYFMPLDKLEIDIQLEKYYISYSECLHLESMGLLHCNKDISLNLYCSDTLTYLNQNHCIYEDRYILDAYPMGDDLAEIACFVLTQPGIEILSIATVKPNWDYYFDCCDLFYNNYNIYLACEIDNNKG